MDSLFTLNISVGGEDWGEYKSLEGRIIGLTSTLLSLQDIRWLKSITNLPILIKGVLTHEDGKAESPPDNIFISLFLYLYRIDYKEDHLHR